MARKSRASLPLAILGLSAGLAALGPRVAEIQASSAWARWHGARGADAVHGLDTARRVGRDTARAVRAAAPLPFAAEAAGAALAIARPLVATRPAAASVLLEELRKSLDPIAASSWRGYGLKPFAASAANLAGEAARAAREKSAPLAAAERPSPEAGR